MAFSSSSSSPRTWRYNVFVSFHGPDTRKTFLSHLRKQFSCNGITMFDDQGIERGQTIAPELTEGIRESRISIVVLSKNYASSSWCLDELSEILKCKKDMGHIAMTVFYGVDPSDVRKQTGEFGRVFNETCARKTEEEMHKWSHSLTDVGNIAGEHSLNWDNEAKFIEKIVKDVFDKLNARSSWDFDGMVGLDAHLKEMESLLELDYVGVKMVGISGPAGIGKSTIARALHSLLSNMFQLTCFLDNLRGSYPIGLDEYGLKLRLQEELLSKILNQNGMKICHLGVIKERLRDQRVLIILDDVNNIRQLEALANETTWFGAGSRIVVTTENKEILQQHGINNTYHVEFLSSDQALKILCRYAFRKSYPHKGFKKLALRITELCGNLPLGLRVVGSSLQGKNEEEWEEVTQRLDTILDHEDIEQVLRVGYESLHENEQSLFFHIAVFFNYKDCDLVKTMFADNTLDIKHGLKILVNKSLIYISNNGEIVMHKLLQQVGTKAVRREEPWKHRILIDAPDICDVLERAKGTRAVSGISFDISDTHEVSISESAFKRMPSVRFLKVYKSKDGGNDIVHIPKKLELPKRLRLLHWEAYPRKFLPSTLHPEYLVELSLRSNKLKKLWEGIQPLANLKEMDLLWSLNLEELPDLSKAENLERLLLCGCKDLVEIPSCIGKLHKLESLDLAYCIRLRVVPSFINLTSLAFLDMKECFQLRKFPDIPTNIRALVIEDTMLEEMPRSIRFLSCLGSLSITGICAEKLPDCIKDLHGLESLHVAWCQKLKSLPELPGSLRTLKAQYCESLETLVSFPFDSAIEVLDFSNCFKLGQEAKRIITQQSFHVEACLPETEIPAAFNHQARGNSLTIRSDFNVFRICAVVSPKQDMNVDFPLIFCRIRINNGCPTDGIVKSLRNFQAEHLCISYIELFDEDGGLELGNEIMFEIITTCQGIDIIKCGVQVLTDKTDGSISSDEVGEPRVKYLKT